MTHFTHNPPGNDGCCAVLLAAFAAILFASAAAGYQIEEPFYRLSAEYVSPHIAWAKPYVRGPVRALVIAPRGTQRETLELAERMDLDYQYVLTLSDTELGWGPKSSGYAMAEGITQEEMEAELREKLKDDYDVIIIGHLDWNMFPRDLLYSLMKKVYDGMGLVYTYADYGRNQWVTEMLSKARLEAPHGFVTAGVPFDALPVLRDLGPEKVVALSGFKEGRIAALTYSRRPRFQFLTPTPADDDASYRELHYEYYQSLVIKAVLWAAKKEPEVFFRALGLPTATPDRADLPKAVFVAEMVADGPGDKLAAEWTLRDEDGRVWATTKADVAAGGRVTFGLPTLPEGHYFGDVRLLREGRVVNWGTAAFTVTSRVGIESVETDKPTYEVGEPVKATVTLRGKAPVGAKMEARVIDALGRLVARQVQPAAPQVTLELTAARPLTIWSKVDVSLLQGKDPVSSRSAEFTVQLRDWDRFIFAVWSADSNVNEFVRRRMYDRLHECGVDTFTNSSLNAVNQRWSARYNFDTIPYMTRYSYDGKDPDLIRRPCLTDPKFLEPHLAELEKNAAVARLVRPRAYTLGDECFLARDGQDVCFSPTCTADLREWLRQEYDSVEALNRSWGTDFKSIDEATPISLSDAKANGQWARWVDHRRHMEFVYARMMQRAREAIRKADPHARVGFDGPFDTDSVSGNDWWQLMQAFDLCNVYFHEPDEWEHVRSFAKPGTMLGLWFGGYFENRTEDYERLFPWQALFHGFDSVWWYAVYHGLATCPMDAVTPSMTIYPAFQWATEEVQEIKAGLAAALLHAPRQHNIGVHYSQSSVHAATFAGDFGLMPTVWRQVYTVLEDLGYQYLCRSYAQVEQDGIDPREFPVFVLPYSQALSPAEARQMRAYVENGGTLLADVRPGVMDQHGKAQSPGLLDDLFGIQRAPGRGVLHNVEGTVNQAFETFHVQATLPGLEVDGDVALAGGTALGAAGDVPILIVHRVGRGRAILLNFSFKSAQAARARPDWEVHGRVLRGLLALAGVQPTAALRTADGELQTCETVCFKDGPVEYVGFLKYRADPAEGEARARVAFGEAKHTYDVRTGEYLGRVKRFETAFTPSRANLFARLPYRVTALRLSLDRPSYRPGETVIGRLTVMANAQALGRHWVHVRALGPDGRERPHYVADVPVVNGTAVATIPLALNDPAGPWRLLAREVASGQTAEATVTVK